MEMQSWMQYFWINRAWLYKDLKIWDFQQMELGHTVAYRAWKSEALGSILTRDNILLLDYFLFSCDSVESTEYISI